MKKFLAVFFCLLGALDPVPGQETQPLVAIHDSEFTRALESMPASGATPTGPGYTGNQWWFQQWHYFVMPDSVKEALRSDGTAYTVVGDSNILAGALTNADGSPRYPILISLGAEAVDDGEIAALTNYVAAGGFLFVGSSSFTRNTNGTTRGDFAIAGALGIHMITPALTNWYFDDTFSVNANHRLVANIPAGNLEWQMPESSEEISWPVDAHLLGETPNSVGPGMPHMIWQVQTTNATVVATGDAGIPYLLVQPYGRGYFIYDASLQPLLGHGGWAPGMYAYSIFRNAIQWAFQSAGLPVVKLSPWPYPYDAAVIFRHDMEAIPTNVISIERSAQFEHANGASGDYYFCTGTLRLDMPNPVYSNTVASLQRAMTNGASIYSHNGGLTNINSIYNPHLTLIESNLNQLISEGWLTAFEPYTYPQALAPLTTNNYDYWHWGPDELLGASGLLGGFTNASLYVFQSLSNSFVDIAGWHLTNGGPRGWVCPYFNATKEGSYQVEQQLGVQMTGDDKLTPFPHWIFSTQTPDKYYSILSEPVSDWFIGDQVAQSMENGHTLATIQAGVDFYYNLGGLINFYCHSTSDGSGMDGTLPGSYCTYAVAKPRMWSTNAAGIYNWWLERSNAQMSASFSASGGQSITTIALSGNSDTNAAIELVAPGTNYATLQVLTNGVAAGTSVYRTNGLTIKILVGTSVTNAVVRYILPPTVQNNFYQTPQGTPLVVPAPGVLTNGSTTATAALVGGTANGTLTLSANGSFTYTPTNNFAGVDNFSYEAVSGTLTSAVATATIMVTTPGELFFDDFARPASDHSIFPWVDQFGTWAVTNGMLIGSSTFNNYGVAYYSANWTNYSVQAQVRFSSSNAFGGALAGRLNPVNGARYNVWVYPENSPGTAPAGRASLQIIKYSNWTAYTAQNLVPLPGLGTNAHTVRLAFLGNTVSAYFDGNLITNLADNGTFDGQPALPGGGIDTEVYTVSPTTFTMSVDGVQVSTATTAGNDAYTNVENATLNVSAPGVLANDISGNGGALTALPAGSPAHGTLTLTNNGGFAYTPANGYVGTDTFTYKATDGQTTSGVATVTITLASTSSIPPTANNDSYVAVTNTALHVPAPGVLGNDTGGSGPLTTVLGSSPAFGSLVLTNNGGFSYLPATNFAGPDSFTYSATDGQATSAVASVQLMVAPPGYLFYDGFARAGNSSSIFPWINERGSWSITNNILFGTCSLDDYGYADYENSNWTDYVVDAHIHYFSTNVWGGAIGGRLNPATGARYDVWVYPENSPWGPDNGVPAGVPTMQIIKYSDWINYTAQNLIRLPAVGTNWHDVRLAFQGGNVLAYFDGSLMTNLVDNGAFDGQPRYTNGGVTVEMYAATPTSYFMAVSNVAVYPLLLNQSYSTKENTLLTVPDPGVLTGASDLYGFGLTAATVSGPAHGVLTLTNNGGFSYTPTNNFGGTDTFVYRASSGATNLGSAGVTITVIPILTVTASNQSRSYGVTNPVFTAGYNGFVNGDTTNVLSGAPAISTPADTNSPIGNYLITIGPGTLAAPGYSLAFSNGTLTVNPAALTVTAANTNKIYGQTISFAGTEFFTSGLVNGDTVSHVTLASSGAAAAAGVAGSPYPINASNATGGGLANYLLTYQSGILTVNPVTLTVAADNKTRIYSLTNPILTASDSGFVNGEGPDVLSGSPSLNTTATPGSPPGAYPITIALGTLNSTNYTFAFTNGTLTVTSAPAPVILSFDVSNQVFTVTWSSVSGATYELQAATNLYNAIWNSLAPDVIASGLTASRTNAVSAAPQQFYRLLLKPAGP